MGRTVASIYKEMRERQRSTNSGIRISHSASVNRIEKFYQESNLHHFKVYSDEHAEPWGGTDKAPSPLGYLFSAIGFSINNQILIQSEANGVKLDLLETVVTGWFDPKGSLGIRGHNPRISRITLQLKVASSSPIGKVNWTVRKAALCDAIYQTLARGTKVERKVTLVGARPSGGDSVQGGNEAS